LFILNIFFYYVNYTLTFSLLRHTLTMEVSTEIHALINQLREEGQSFRKIAKIVNKSPSAVQYIMYECIRSRKISAYIWYNGSIHLFRYFKK
jgi:hypothetical protein